MSDTNDKSLKQERMTSLVQVPSVGRQVFYYAYGTPGGEFPSAVARAATITEVDRPGDPHSPVSLAVFTPTGLFFNQHLPYGPQEPGHWGWPEYVGPILISKE